MENKPNISPNFTVDDIHKVREWNYERRKNMTNAEILADIKHGADEFLGGEKAEQEEPQRKAAL